MKGNHFPKLDWNNKLSQLNMIINYTDLCEDTDRVDGFSIIINNDLSRLGKIEFQTHLNKFAIFQTDLRATHVVLKGHLLPTGNTLNINGWKCGQIIIMVWLWCSDSNVTKILLIFIPKICDACQSPSK